jgi:hypothetical protein
LLQCQGTEFSSDGNRFIAVCGAKAVFWWTGVLGLMPDHDSRRCQPTVTDQEPYKDDLDESEPEAQETEDHAFSLMAAIRSLRHSFRQQRKGT